MSMGGSWHQARRRLLDQEESLNKDVGLGKALAVVISSIICCMLCMHICGEALACLPVIPPALLQILIAGGMS